MPGEASTFLPPAPVMPPVSPAPPWPILPPVLTAPPLPKAMSALWASAAPPEPVTPPAPVTTPPEPRLPPVFTLPPSPAPPFPPSPPPLLEPLLRNLINSGGGVRSTHASPSVSPHNSANVRHTAPLLTRVGTFPNRRLRTGALEFGIIDLNCDRDDGLPIGCNPPTRSHYYSATTMTVTYLELWVIL